MKISFFNYKKHKAKYIITTCIPKINIKKFTFFSLPYIRMSTNIINFNDNLNGNFYNRDKKIFNIDDIDIDSKKETYGKYNSFKYFIGYNVNIFIRPLYLFIPQTTSYINKFDENKITMSLIIKDTQLFKNTIKYRKKN